MKVSRALYVYWPVLLFLSTAIVGWFYDPALMDSTLPFSWDPSRTVAYYMPNIILGHSPHILMSNVDRLIASVWIVVSVGLTIRAARQIR